MNWKGRLSYYICEGNGEDWTGLLLEGQHQNSFELFCAKFSLWFSLFNIFFWRLKIIGLPIFPAHHLASVMVCFHYVSPLNHIFTILKSCGLLCFHTTNESHQSLLGSRQSGCWSTAEFHWQPKQTRLNSQTIKS